MGFLGYRTIEEGTVFCGLILRAVTQTIQGSVCLKGGFFVSLSPVKPLQPPDTFPLQAAQGWMELGNHEEANEELELIDAPLRAHLDVLEVRWLILSEG